MRSRPFPCLFEEHDMSTQRLLRIVLCLCAFVIVSGCGSKSESESKPATPAETFKTEQADTTTPHGKIVRDSIRDGSDGSVLYRTSDGKSWRTRMNKRGDGSRSWAEPEPVGQTQ